LSVDEIEQGRFCSKHLFFFTLDGYSMALNRFSAEAKALFTFILHIPIYIFIGVNIRKFEVIFYR
jgi:hypothetical protein